MELFRISSVPAGISTSTHPSFVEKRKNPFCCAVGSPIQPLTAGYLCSFQVCSGPSQPDAPQLTVLPSGCHAWSWCPCRWTKRLSAWDSCWGCSQRGLWHVLCPQNGTPAVQTLKWHPHLEEVMICYGITATLFHRIKHEWELHRTEAGTETAPSLPGDKRLCCKEVLDQGGIKVGDRRVTVNFPFQFSVGERGLFLYS